MRAQPSIAGVGLALAVPFLIAACGPGGHQSADVPTETTPALKSERSIVPTPTADPLAPRDVQVSPSLILKPERLSALAPDAEKFLLGRQPQWGVAVIVPERGIIYEENAEMPFPMASVAKIAIMVTVMDQSIRQGRDLTNDEMIGLRAMITTSDNDSATALWRHVGGGKAISAYLDSIGIHGMHPVVDDNWGDSTASAASIAQLLAKLSTRQILDDSRRRLALDLLSDVSADQRWGVTAAFRDGQTPGTAAIKDGWYESITGWRVNSVGVDEAHAGNSSLILAVMTRNQPSLQTGVDTIEGLALRVGAVVHGWHVPSTAAPPSTPATTAIRFAPSADGLPQAAGDCAGPSRVAHRTGAWRCAVAGQEFDPCFAAEGDTVLCDAHPLKSGSGMLVKLTKPLPAVRWPDHRATPWFLLLADSSTCAHVEGPPVDNDGDRVTYECSDGGVIIGGVQRGVSWSAFKSAPDLTDPVDTNVLAAWY